MTTLGLVLFVLVAGLFTLKIVWNLGVPYALVARSFRSTESQAKGISLMPMVEVILLGGAVVLSHVRGSVWPWSAAGVALFGMAVIIGSYVHLFVAGCLAGWIARKLRDRRGADPSRR